jgi:hypothetical protein
LDPATTERPPARKNVDVRQILLALAMPLRGEDLPRSSSVRIFRNGGNVSSQARIAARRQ